MGEGRGAAGPGGSAGQRGRPAGGNLRHALRAAGRRGGLARAAYAYGETLRDLHRFAERETALCGALTIYREARVDGGGSAGAPLDYLGRTMSDLESEIQVRSALGTLYNMWARPEQAIPVLEEAARLLPRAGLPPATADRLQAWVMQTLTGAYKLTGRLAEAAALNRRVIELCRRTDNGFVLVQALAERGRLALRDGHHAAAVEDFGQILAVSEQIRHGTGAGTAYERILVEKVPVRRILVWRVPVRMRQGRRALIAGTTDEGPGEAPAYRRPLLELRLGGLLVPLDQVPHALRREVLVERLALVLLREQRPDPLAESGATLGDGDGRRVSGQRDDRRTG